MSEKSEKIYDGITLVGDDLIDEAQESKAKKKRRAWKWLSSAAAVVLAVTVVMTIFTRNPSEVFAIAEAVYPEESAVRVDREAYSEGMADFLKQSIPTFLGGEAGENRVYSPANLYIALSMLAEVTDGESRGQILSLLGSDSVEIQRAKANALWNGEYYNREEGSGWCTLANSLWMNENVNFVPETMNTLAESYYASSYRGDPASESFNAAFRDWLNEQTGGMLKEQVDGLEMNARTVLEMVSTVYFRGRWVDEFDPEDTKPAVFHAPDGDMTCDFMNERTDGSYFWGERFSAVAKSFTNARSMLFVLPDEGTTPEELLEDGEFLSFLSDVSWKWEQNEYLIVNLSVPKFDVSSDTDLTQYPAFLLF